MSPSRIAAVVLAAGMSRRMGRPKALLPLGGVPLIVRVIEPIRAARSIDPIVVVTGHEADQILALLRERGRASKCIHNPDYETGGMLSSIKTGISAIANQCDAFFLVLGDQPNIRPDTYTALMDVCGICRITQPTHEGRPGHPILIHAADLDEILALPNDATLKQYTSAHRRDTLSVGVDDPGILTDIDTPEDYDRAVAIFSAHRSSSCIETQGSKPLATI